MPNKIEIFLYGIDNEKQRGKMLDRLHTVIADAHLNQKDISITIKDLKKSPSNLQRRYLWGCVIAMAHEAMKELGNDDINADYVYDFLKERGKFYTVEKIKIKDNTCPRIVYESFSDKEGERKRLTEFIDFCRRWCAQWLSIDIPDADKYWKEKGVKI